MITNSTNEFFVNGHHCEIKYERREHYTGWINGEQITSSHNTAHIRQTLIDDAKYRVEREPEFWKIVRAVYKFIESQTDRETGDYLWVYNDVVMNQVTPLNSIGPAYRALLSLKGDGLVEEGQICMDMNVEKMWRATGKSLEEV